MRNDARQEKKVSSRELRRAYQAHAEDLKRFTSAASGDLTTLQTDLRVTRELCADLSERIEKVARDLTAARLETVKIAGSQIRFMGQSWSDRLKWLVTGR